MTTPHWSNSRNDHEQMKKIQKEISADFIEHIDEFNAVGSLPVMHDPAETCLCVQLDTNEHLFMRCLSRIRSTDRMTGTVNTILLPVHLPSACYCSDRMPWTSMDSRWMQADAYRSASWPCRFAIRCDLSHHTPANDACASRSIRFCQEKARLGKSVVRPRSDGGVRTRREMTQRVILAMFFITCAT